MKERKHYEGNKAGRLYDFTPEFYKTLRDKQILSSSSTIP